MCVMQLSLHGFILIDMVLWYSYIDRQRDVTCVIFDFSCALSRCCVLASYGQAVTLVHSDRRITCAILTKVYQKLIL